MYTMYLMCLIPAVLVPDAQFGTVVKQCFAAGCVTSCQHSVVEWRQPSSVFIVWRGTKRQQDLQDKEEGTLNLSLCTGHCQKLVVI